METPSVEATESVACGEESLETGADFIPEVFSSSLLPANFFILVSIRKFLPDYS
jgi:hypothetical protein